MSITRRDILRRARRPRASASTASPSRSADASRTLPTPRPASTTLAKVQSTSKYVHRRVIRTSTGSATSPTLPSWALISCGCRWITGAGPTSLAPKALKEPTLKQIDQAVEFGRKYGIHVQINFHRAPGPTVASPPEPRSLWTDSEVQEICPHLTGRPSRRVTRECQTTRSASTRSTSPTKGDADDHRA